MIHAIGQLVQWLNPIETVTFKAIVVERERTNCYDQDGLSELKIETGRDCDFSYFNAAQKISKSQYESYLPFQTLSHRYVPPHSDGNPSDKPSIVEKSRAIHLKKAAVYAGLASAVIKLYAPQVRWPNVLANASAIGAALMASCGGATGRRLAWVPAGYVLGKLGADLARQVAIRI